ncbi:TonB-dependent receptor [Terriglobus saanensis]|uniref:TonB-dependent receptor n=1 Tax=Terriglobus saanensis (strain ATCC BAA-1853 / DSM 23119 / SP1PR4) TaxID=401053 RepID=E8V119_TERSS|nr:TonB-dependent receptor [Terriglobus saanensis]ADV83367.1 TonB-dependent receptor [Terriglobus saanensis SP1PR4]
MNRIFFRSFVFALSIFLFAAALNAQTASGSLSGIVTDSTGAVIPGATITIENPVSGFKRSFTTDSAGHFTATNLPFNRYHVTALAAGFSSSAQDAAIRGAGGNTTNFQLSIGVASEITVESDDMVSNNPVSSNTIDRNLFDKLPLESTSAPLSSLVTQSTPGIASDSNGLFHPMGEHADTTFAIDGQSISDQQSRVFGNPPSTNIIQSINVINGIAPPEYGDKASLVVETTTRSGLGLVKPTGTVSLTYGSFGTTTAAAAIGLGTKRFGDFLSVDGVNAGRYLDTPEFRPVHDHGNNFNVFDRFDLKPTEQDALQLNLSFSRSWFQQPDQFDQETQDQRAQIFSFNIAPSWTHTLSAKSLFTIAPFLRQDNFHYYPSKDITDDTPVTLSQSRRLQQAGGRGDFIFTSGINTFKVGITGSRYGLAESFGLGVTDPTFNPPCFDASGNPVTDPSVTNPSQCAALGFTANDGFLSGLAPYDLSRGGQLYHFQGTAPIFEEAAYISDTIAWKNWTVLLGGRFDNYSGLSSRSMAQPRLGVSYTVPKAGTVLRLGYGKFFLTPYNENLIVSSSTGIGGLESTSATPLAAVPLKPASRHQYNAGFEQGVSRYLVVSAEYFWKYTDRDFDFDIVVNSPLAFPIQWQKSKIDGLGIKLTVPNYKGFSAYSSLGHTRSRFFGPEVGGVLSNDPTVNTSAVFRIDHDQAFQQSTNATYQFHHSLYGGFTWHYESGLVAGAGRDDLLGLTGDQQAALKLTCGSQAATINNPIIACAPNDLKTPVLNLPAEGTENDDKNPNRVAPRTLFDATVGWDDIFHVKDGIKTNVSVLATNLTNRYAVYNFLSTFSGTHFVSPRAITGKVSFNF